MKKAQIQQILKEHKSNCKDCFLCDIRLRTTTIPANRFVYDQTCQTNPILFVGEAPGEREDAVGLPFIGPSGTLLDRLLIEADIKHYVITNAVVCTPFDDINKTYIRTPEKGEIDNCVTHLLFLLQKLKPSAIALLGTQADKAYDRLLKLNTTEVKPPAYRFVHPAFILRSGGIASVEYKRTLLKMIRMKAEIDT